MLENATNLNIDGNELKEKFFDDFKPFRCQASYIPVFLLCFFQNVDEKGTANLDKISEAFADFYKKRRKYGLVVEKNNGIFQKEPEPSLKDIKKLILFNPLGRSFLLKFFEVDKNDYVVILNSNMWEKMTAIDVSKVFAKCNEILNDYYDDL